MIKIIDKLSNQLFNDLKNADNIWIAVALMKIDALNKILKSISNNCKQNYLVGYNLPTDLKSFKKLFNLSKKYNVKAKCIRNIRNFHPKLYMIKKLDKHIAYIGSANCTNGGFDNNIEMNTRIDDENTFNKLLEWFDNIFDKAEKIDKKFIDYYDEYYNKLKNNEKIKNKLLKELEDKINKKNKKILINKTKIVDELKNYKNDIKIYNEDIAEREKAVKNIRRTLDYPYFNNINIDEFIKIPHLGRIDARRKNNIKSNIDKFKILLKYVCDDSISVEERIETSFNKLKVPGVGENILTKILTVHDPNNYFVYNHKFNKFFNIYGPEYQRGLSFGRKYIEILEILKEIKKEADIQDFAVFDCFVWRKTEEKTNN